MGVRSIIRLASAAVTPPVQGQQVVGRRRGGALDHGPDGGVLAGDLVALAVAEREDVQQQRLLDLGAVEQVAAALGCQLRVVGQHHRGAEQPSSSSVARTGKVLTFSRRAAAPAPSRSSGEANRPADSRSTGCVDSRLERSASARRGRAATAVVLCTQSVTRGRPPPRSSAASRTRPGRRQVERLDAGAASPTGSGPSSRRSAASGGSPPASRKRTSPSTVQPSRPARSRRS